MSKPNKHSYPHLAPPNLAKGSPVVSTFFGDPPPGPPQRALAFALDNQDMPHKNVQQSVIFTTKLDALTLKLREKLVH
ncbi:MAG: hypothetical protein HRU34_09710 [Richelia sp.]|nr:hypothetical protein [Richelia sp.]